MARLGDICKKASSSVAQKDLEEREGQYPIYGASGLIKYVDFYHQEKPYVAVVKDGAGVGRVMQLPAKSSVIGTMQYIIPNDGVNVSYLAYALEHMNLSKYYTGATIPHIYFKDYCNETMPDHGKDEQEYIAEILDKVNSLVVLRKQQLTKLDELVKARFVELFGEVETLTYRWEVKKFAEVTINLDSTRKPVKDADRQKMQGQYPYYGATGIVDYVNDYRIDGTFLLISEDGKALEFRNKNIAFIASGKIWVNNHAHVLQCTEDVEMIFLMYYMNFRNISDWVTGIDQKKLNRANMDKIPVGLPPIVLQKQFAAFVEQTDKSKLAIQESLDKLETLKKALMQKYFG